MSGFSFLRSRSTTDFPFATISVVTPFNKLETSSGPYLFFEASMVVVVVTPSGSRNP